MRKLKLLVSLFFAAFMLISCGDSSGGVVSPNSQSTRYYYDYFYTQECVYRGYEYICEDTPWTLASVFTIIMKEYFDGYIEITYDGKTYSFYPSQYDYAWDSYSGRSYYQFFLLGDMILTIYSDGSEAIFTDEFNGTETHYFYSY